MGSRRSWMGGGEQQDETRGEMQRRKRRKGKSREVEAHDASRRWLKIGRRGWVEGRRKDGENAGFCFFLGGGSGQHKGVERNRKGKAAVERGQLDGRAQCKARRAGATCSWLGSDGGRSKGPSGGCRT